MSKIKGQLEELTSRDIPGNGGHVRLMMSVTDSQPHEVVVTLPDGTEHKLVRLMGREALDAYYHPFADDTVPNVFKPARLAEV